MCMYMYILSGLWVHIYDSLIPANVHAIYNASRAVPLKILHSHIVSYRKNYLLLNLGLWSMTGLHFIYSFWAVLLHYFKIVYESEKEHFLLYFVSFSTNLLQVGVRRK
jgi:hypothetical protein